MLSRSIRKILVQRRKNARNLRRFARVTNLSFSCSSLLALTVCLVRIRQATARPRLISLPTQFCGIIDWLVSANRQAPWLRMGTEGTRRQVQRFSEQEAKRQTNVCLFALSLVSRAAACLIPSLNLFAAATHHRPQLAIELFTCPFLRTLRGDRTDGAFRWAYSSALALVALPRTGAKTRV
jgi:hypothetical protein